MTQQNSTLINVRKVFGTVRVITPEVETVALDIQPSGQILIGSDTPGVDFNKVRVGQTYEVTLSGSGDVRSIEHATLVP